jgi:hypothetical protein
MKNTTNFSSKLGVSKIFILVIIAVLVIGGIFVWQNREKEWFVKKEKPKLPKGIEIIEQGDKKIVRNKAEGYEVTVPKEWKVRNLIKPDYVSFHSVSPTGICKYEIYAIENENNYSIEEYLNQLKINEEFLTIKSDQRTIVNINGLNFVKRFLDTEENGPSYIIYTKAGNKIYEISVSVHDVNDGCIQNFDVILKNLRLF